MKNQKGFTLIELLIVLSISFLLIVIGGSIQFSIIEKQKNAHALEIFQNDVLYMQQVTMVTRENVFMNIYPKTNTYEIKKGGLGKTLIQRTFPKEWIIKLQTLTMPLSFAIDGTIKNPGMFSIHTNRLNYYVYFPFGKGRCYFIEK